MKVLVTGASGYIGSHCVVSLLQAGHEVIAFVRNPDKLATTLAPFGLDEAGLALSGVALGDLGDPATIAQAAVDVDAIVHTAADVGVAGKTGPEGDLNVVGTTAVLDAAHSANIERVVYTSTLAAFLPSDDDVLTADSPLAEPLSAYGQSKRDAELAVRSAQDDGLGVISLYPGGVYGPYGPNLDNGFAAIIGAITFGMMCPPGGMGVIDVRDLADIVTRTLELPAGPRRYMCGGHFMSWPQWTATLAQASGLDIGSFDVTTEAMVKMGRDFDEQRETLGIDTPLSEEAAIIMSAGRPTDDSPMLSDLGITLRPALQTFADSVAYLRALGAIPTLEP